MDLRGATADPDEHVRLAHYRRALAEAAPQDAAAVVARVLADPDPAMAGGAVCEYLDRRAAELLTGPEFPSWKDGSAVAAAADAFAVRRLDEWALLRAMTLGEPWAEERLLAASNWLQLHAAGTCPARACLTVLAEHGRTRRIRALAAGRLGTSRRPGGGASRRSARP
ncbi:hypothetical protein AB0O91_33585 [Kitasatospora sp. NPDC089797]|uniref:hypothetical protein n=1 Tax=Kitasatospora sp. NPDC089797 TaxID=3155298 RepID=UPI00342566CC